MEYRRIQYLVHPPGPMATRFLPIASITSTDKIVSFHSINLPDCDRNEDP
jgi:hypothetical protein